MKSLDRLLSPKSLTVIGGGAWCEAVLEQAQKFGFPGQISAIHPTKSDICGIRAYKGANDLPDPPDAAFIGINREATVGAVERLRKRGAGGAVCFASGFAEATAQDASGAGAQERLLLAAKEMPVLGPNCYGFINALDRVAVWPDQHGMVPVERGVAILTQSSNISINLTMQSRALPIAMMIACGNQAQTTQAEIGMHLLDDPRITALGLHIEGFGDLRGWEALAAKSRSTGKPLVALKVGRSQQAQEATISHTASMAGGAAGSDAFLDRLGIARVDDLPTFLETLKLLHCSGRLGSNRIGSISCSGGEASLVADMAHDRDLSFPPLTQTQRTALRDALGPKVALANPLDYHTYIWRDVPAMTKAWSAMVDPGHDFLLTVVDFPRSDICDPADWSCATEAAIAVRKETGAPIGMVATLPELMPETVARHLISHGVVAFSGLDEALAAIEIAARPLPDPADPVALPDPPTDTLGLSEREAKAKLAAYGLPVPKSVHAGSTEEIADASKALSFPVVLKSEGHAHKSDLGGVALHLSSADEVRQAALAMPETSGFLLEEMAPAGVELLIGVTLDEAYGYVLTLAAGGVFTEVMRDQTHLLLPVTETDVKQALKRLKINLLLDGFRGRSAKDTNAIWRAVESVQRYTLENGKRVSEIEINPLIVSEDGALAVDALIREEP